jgi:nucleoside-diphosphate-sugar epimerase
MSQPRILVTGVTGKVGTAFINALLSDDRYNDFVVCGLLHYRKLDTKPRLEFIQGQFRIKLL